MMFRTILAAGLLTLAPAAYADQEAGWVFKDCPDCPELVVVPAGSARIGSNEQERAGFSVPQSFAAREGQLNVTIAKPFAVGRFEVTRDQYAAYVADAKVPFEAGCAGYDPAVNGWPMRPGLSWRDPGFEQSGRDPVVCLNWYDAKAYVAWLSKRTGKNYRLLSEVEWEYAARGGSTGVYPWGSSPADMCSRANIYDRPTAEALQDKDGLKESLCLNPPQGNFTDPVGSYAPNGFGLYDVIGNAWELVEDCASDSYADVPTDGTVREQAGCTMRMPRGGGWNSRAWTARLSTRGKGDAEYRAVALGMRIARDLD